LDKCISCGKCFNTCSFGAHKITNNNREFIRELCTGCGKCSELCYVEALVLRGRTATVNEVIDEVVKDRSYYESSGGGVTFSGGEPLYQKDFILALLRECKAIGLHTAIETAGNVPVDDIKSIIPFVDLWLYDIKTLNEQLHKDATGVDNYKILENIRVLAALRKEIIIRVPVIPGVNDNINELERIADFVLKLQYIKSVELLPFHQMAGGKYESLGMLYKAGDIKVPEHKSMLEFVRMFSELGINAKVI